METWIIEDEAAAARRLEKLILTVEPSAEITARLDSIESVLNWVQDAALPDLIFLDIQLADGLSFDIFNHVKIDKPIIFTTAYDQYAIQAFQLRAIDYLLKPIKQEELAKAIDKYRNWMPNTLVNYQELATALRQEAIPHRFLIRIGQRIRLVDVQDVAYFYTEDKITFLTCWDGQRYPLDKSLDKLEVLLQPDAFFRINRQFIIHLKAIKDMLAYSKSRVKLELSPPSKLETVVSTERSPHFKRWLTGRMECGKN